jgi:hypothetical protein
MKNLLIWFLLILLSTSYFGQKNLPFVGILEYEIKNLDIKDEKPKLMHVLSLDSLIRIETESYVFGNQSYIKHLVKKKSYLLISLGENQHYAIKGDFSKSDSLTLQPKYIWKKKLGGKKIGGLAAKKIKLTFLQSQKSFTCYYSKKYAARYQEAYTDFPGLPVLYYLETEDGIIEYRLKKYTNVAPNYELFGVPSNYTKITFDEFVDLLNNSNQND